MNTSEKLSLNNGISIIVPIFNCERYLEACVNSILNQTFRNLEVLLIDDGSKDGSYEKAKQLAEADQRIKVFHKENQGAAAARNYGVRNAAGKYITFVDADDTIEPDYCLKLYELINDDSEYTVSVCGYARLNENGIKISADEDLQEYRKESGGLYEKYLRDIIKTKKIFGACWRTLIPKKLLTERRIEFPHCLLSEDKLFFLSVLGCCDGVKVCKDSLYNYRCNSSSVTMNKRYIKELLTDRLVYINELQNRLKLCGLNVEEYERMIDYDTLTFRIVLFLNASFGLERKAENKEIAESVFCRRRISADSVREWKKYQNAGTKAAYYLTKFKLYGVLALIRNMRKAVRRMRMVFQGKKRG